MSESNNNEQSEKRKRAPNWTDEEKEYLRNNIHKTVAELAKDLNGSENSVRIHKNTLGLKRGNCPPFTEEEKKIIKEVYSTGQGVDLTALSTYLNRLKTSIGKIAHEMGLSHYGNYTNNESRIRGERMSIMVKSIEHPRGMLGKKHTEETRKYLSEFHKKRASQMTYEEKHAIAMKGVKVKREKGSFNTSSNAYSRCKQGKRKDLNQYFRSSWEANIARYLNFHNIKWLYEFKRFDFNDEATGVLSYQPDFYLSDLDIWIEVKGWMDDKSKQRLFLFEKYYPNENNKLVLIDSKQYYIIEKRYKNIIPNWE